MKVLYESEDFPHWQAKQKDGLQLADVQEGSLQLADVHPRPTNVTCNSKFVLIMPHIQRNVIDTFTVKSLYQSTSPSVSE